MKRLVIFAAVAAALGGCGSHRQASDSASRAQVRRVEALHASDSLARSLVLAIDSPVVVFRSVDSPAVCVEVSGRRLRMEACERRVGRSHEVAAVRADSAATLRSDSESAVNSPRASSMLPLILVVLVFILYFAKKCLNLR